MQQRKRGGDEAAKTEVQMQQSLDGPSGMVEIEAAAGVVEALVHAVIGAAAEKAPQSDTNQLG